MIKFTRYEDSNGQDFPVAFSAPNTCPMCHSTIDPIYVSGYLDNYNKKEISVFYFCKACMKTFITRYKLSGNTIQHIGSSFYIAELVSSEPVTTKTPVFSTEITSVSPQFVKIFGQASAAEQLGLDEICGIGYRKALEFLTKDYCKHLKPEETKSIETKRLKECIDTYFDDQRIKALATVSAYIGNDETHYLRRYDHGTVSEMKSFIDAMVNLITSNMKADEALEALRNSK